MELTVKHYTELTRDELFEICRLRIAVFVVEQRCPYQEIDEADRRAYHLYFREDGRIVAYLRLLPRGAVFPDVSLGRVLAVQRRRGLASALLRAAIETARDKLSAERIVIEAQTYARTLYEKLGFAQTSGEFLEDGIPHIQMTLSL